MFGSLSHQPPGPVKMLTALGWWWHTPHDTMDHIDPENLERDTRIILEVLWRLLNSPVLPYDYAAYATSLQAELDHLEATLDGRLDISALKGAASELERQATALARLSNGASGETADRINASLLRASRQLVPLNYTSGERFHHDPALSHRPWPSLEGIGELARLPAGSPDTAFYAVHARQTRNRIASALRQANEALREALAP
jgi:hypothetical protein